MRVLGIETSCDETAAAVVENGCRLLGNAVTSSIDLHIRYGGVVPEIAARSHIEAIVPVIEQALRDAGTDWDGIDAVAVTRGAGLGGSLLIVALFSDLSLSADAPSAFASMALLGAACAVATLSLARRGAPVETGAPPP